MSSSKFVPPSLHIFYVFTVLVVFLFCILHLVSSDCCFVHLSSPNFSLCVYFHILYSFYCGVFSFIFTALHPIQSSDTNMPSKGKISSDFGRASPHYFVPSNLSLTFLCSIFTCGTVPAASFSNLHICVSYSSDAVPNLKQ